MRIFQTKEVKRTRLSGFADAGMRTLMKSTTLGGCVVEFYGNVETVMTLPVSLVLERTKAFLQD